MNFILTYRNIFCSLAQSLFDLEHFCSCFHHAKNKNNINNNKASFRTFERYSRSKITCFRVPLRPPLETVDEAVEVAPGDDWGGGSKGIEIGVDPKFELLEGC